jgi:hypothetical protein
VRMSQPFTLRFKEIVLREREVLAIKAPELYRWIRTRYSAHDFNPSRDGDVFAGYNLKVKASDHPDMPTTEPREVALLVKVPIRKIWKRVLRRARKSTGLTPSGRENKRQIGGRDVQSDRHHDGRAPHANIVFLKVLGL